MNERTARARRRPAARKGAESAPAAAETPLGQLFDSLSDLTSDLTSSALRLATRTRESAARAIARTPEQLRMMAAAGESLRDLREVAGLTVLEITDALNLRDKGFWEAVEDGREVLSFDLILRLASLVARNDPLPFVLKYTRTYNPRLWEIMHELKLDQLPLQFERERSFINIYRRHDAARKLSDAGFERVLGFTQHAFDLAIHFVAEQEQWPPATPDPGKRGARLRRRR
jgi:transcriptional regulator with XRE-family HTH domain